MGELVFVGLGLAGTQDLTLRALAAIREADDVVAEFYTSFLVGATHADLEEALGRTVRVLDREAVESGAADLLKAARTRRVAFLTAGDPMTATTHQDLRQRAHQAGIQTRIVHGVSIQTAAPGAAGLQSYKFGRTTTLVLPEPNYRPTSPYDVIAENRARGLHTLVLLDIRAHEGRYMTAAEGARLLVALESELGRDAVAHDRPIVALARVGAPDQRIAYAPPSTIATLDLGGPPHCLIVPGELHFSEQETLASHAGQPPPTGSTRTP